MKYTKTKLQEVVVSSLSVAEVLRKLNLKQAGGNYSYIKRKIKEFDISTDHFLPNTHYLKTGGNKNPWQNILVERSKGARTSAFRLRRALIESGREYKCEYFNGDVVCGINQWNNKILILEVDHIDNNWLNNQKENLRFLCPNCHSQLAHKMNKGLTEVTKVKWRNGIRAGQASKNATN